MPTRDDAPTLAPVALLNEVDLVDVFDASTRRALAVKVGHLRGAQSGDATTVTGTSATVSTQITVCTSTSAVALTLPLASGDLRRLFILKASATSDITVGRAGSDLIVSGEAVDATSITVAAGKAAILISDGVTWFHVSNDA